MHPSRAKYRNCTQSTLLKLSIKDVPNLTFLLLSIEDVPNVPFSVLVSNVLLELSIVNTSNKPSSS